MTQGEISTYLIPPYSIGTAEVTPAKTAAAPMREATNVTIVSGDQKCVDEKLGLDKKKVC